MSHLVSLLCQKLDFDCFVLKTTTMKTTMKSISSLYTNADTIQIENKSIYKLYFLQLMLSRLQIFIKVKNR